jgi:hypothetical protein
MLEQMIAPQLQIYHDIIKPISHYEQYVESISTPAMLNYAKQAQFIVTSTREIVDDLNVDKDRFEEFLSTLDDDYDLLEKFYNTFLPKNSQEKEIKKITDKLLTNLILLQNDISIILSKLDENS